MDAKSKAILVASAMIVAAAGKEGRSKGEIYAHMMPTFGTLEVFERFYAPLVAEGALKEEDGGRKVSATERGQKILLVALAG